MADVFWTGGVDGNWNTAGNWSGGTVPAINDNVWFVDNSNDLDAGLDQSAGNALTSLHVEASYTGKIGTTSEYLQIKSTSVFIGQHQGLTTPAGSSLIKVDTGTTASTVRVYSTATQGVAADDLPVQIIANHASTDIYVFDGKVGIQWRDPTLSTVTVNQIHVGKLDGSTSPSVFLGDDVSAGGLFSYSGTVVCWSGNIDLGVRGGTVTVNASGTFSAITVDAGTLYLDRHGTLTTLTIEGGTVDTTRTDETRTITNCTIDPKFKSCTFKVNENVTITNDVETIKRVQLVATVL